MYEVIVNTLDWVGRRAIAVATFCVVCVATSSSAQDVKFNFVNPSFGGNPFNSGHLIGLAEIQNRHEEPQDTELSTGNSQADLFVRQLQSRLLSSLSGGLTEVISGAQPGDADTIVIGDQQIFYERSLENIRVEITNLLDGSSTEIVLPVLQDSAIN